LDAVEDHAKIREAISCCWLGGLATRSLGIFKPVRILAPQFAGAICAVKGVCVDDLERLNEAVALKENAVLLVQEHGGAI
jgi:hypothetical protein